ncbi:CSF1 [Sanghuangporus vaninii]
MLKVVLLVVCIAVAVGSVIYFFFWNRILGYFLGALLRLALWTQERTAVWVEFGSFHLSLIAGAIILRDVRYHSSNQSFRIVKVQLNWRWWIRNVAEEEDLAGGHLDGASRTLGKKFGPHCRIHVTMEGFEWFMYNRMASFENILSQLSGSNPGLSGVKTRSRESNSYSLNRSALIRDDERSRSRKQDSLYATGRRVLFAIQTPSFFNTFSSWLRHQLPDLDPKHLLPISFEVVKGAITMGNHTTESLLMAQFTRASGTYGVVQSRSRLDDHKQLLQIKFENATINCVENPDYWKSTYDIARDVNECFLQSDIKAVPIMYTGFKKLWIRCRTAFPFYKTRGNRYAKEQKRKAKGKKNDEETSHVGADFSQLEYAIDRKVLETSELELVYYADVAGLVPQKPLAGLDRNTRGTTKQAKELEFLDIGNGDLPPEWGVEVIVHGGSIHYGPWADRQRVQIQRVFFPQMFRTDEPTTMLSPGDERTCTCLKLFFEFRGVTTMLIPFREASKNWQWDGIVDIPHLRKQREAASIQVRLGEKSTIKYIVPMIATTQGYTAELNIEMDSISVISSLNDIRLLQAESCSVSSLLPSPLEWDAERRWDFDISLDHPTLYIIRDHINLLTDLGKDWASGPPSDFNTYVPITYSLKLILNDFELNLYANDHNIIDRPLDEKDNVLFTLRGDVLKLTASIPSNTFRPLFTEVPFCIICPDVALVVTLPRWNTHGLIPHAVKCLTNIGRLGLFRLDGSYTYHAEVRKDCVDRLKLNMELLTPSLKLVGWLIRHLMVLRENYFGSFTQYSTTREYLSKRENGIPVGDPLRLKYRPGKNNVFHLDLSAVAKDVTVAFPAGIVGFGKSPQESEGIDIGPCAVLAIPDVQVLLRLHDFSMEMSLNVDPVAFSIMDSCLDRLLLSHALIRTSRQLSISGMHITANRLFGPQPHTTTYVCIWNISFGDVKGSLKTTEIQTLIAAGKSFVHGFIDPFNAPSSDYMIPADRDATFWNINLDSLDVSWQIAPAIIRICLTDGLRFAYNNIAAASYRKLISIVAPVIEIQFLVSLSSAKYWMEAGRIRSGISTESYLAPKGWRDDAELQKSFLQEQDAETHRFASLFKDQLGSGKWPNDIYLQSIRVPLVSPPGKRARSQPAAVSSGSRLPLLELFSESESDDERLLSEADRDKRLANSRPHRTAPLSERVKRTEDDYSSSPLDESDETDSVVSDDSWSDYFELGVDDGTDFHVPYLPFCRKIQLRHASSDLDCRTGFVAGKNSALQSEIFSNEASSSSIDAPGVLPVFHPGLSGAERTDAQSRKYVRIKLEHTGIFVAASCLATVQEILEQREYNELSPELRLDELMLKRIAAVTETPISVYDVRLHCVKLCVIHEAADLMKVRPGGEPLSEDYHGFIASRIGLWEAQILLGVSPSNKPGASIDYGKLNFRHVAGSLGTLSTSGMHTRCETRCPSLAFELDLSHLSLALTRARAQVSYDSSELKLFRTAPQVAIIAVKTLEIPVKKLLAAQRVSSSLARFRQKQLVFSILTRTTSAMSKDLLSSVQPAFFVQSGRPHQLRGDNSWKLLYHLRHSLSSLSKEEYTALHHDLRSSPAAEEIDRTLQSRRIPWALEEAIPPVRIESIEALLFEGIKDGTASAKTNDNRPLRLGSFEANSMRLCIACDDLPQSSLVIREIRFRGDLLRRRLIFEAASISPYSSTIRSFRPTSDYVDYGTITAILNLDIDSIQVTVFPNLIGFLQSAVHVSRILSPQPDSSGVGDPAPASASRSPLSGILDNKVNICDVRLSLNHMLVEAAAENLVFEVTSRHCSSCFLGHLTQPLDISSLDVATSYTTGFRDLTVKARTRSFSDKDMDTLASITVIGGACCLLYQNHTPHGSNLRGTLHATSLDLTVPKSAIRLYKFVEQWRQDYLVGLEAMFRSLFSEIKRSPERQPRQVAEKKRLGIHLSFSLSAASVILQVMHGTWLAWTVYGVIGYLMDRSGRKSVARSCGLQLASQVIRLTSTSADASTQRVPKIVLDLPSISASGSFSSERSGFLISVGFLEMKIKPSHWDVILSVQQKFGQDFNDLLHILEDARKKLPGSASSKSSSREIDLPFYVTAKFEGFKIGLQGLSSTQFLECVDIDAVITNKGSPHWHVNFSDLALYLSPGTLSRQKLAEVDRSQLPVLVSVDFQVNNHTTLEDRHRHVRVNVTKLHAILQAHLMGSIGDFADHLQSEIMLRKERRAEGLREFKEKAMKVMKAFNLNPRKSSVDKRERFFDNSSFLILMANFGAVFPLDLERRQGSSSGSDNILTTKALLLSIKSFTFETHKGDSGDAFMEDFCLQFVSRFDPSNPDDFCARRHHTLNQMLYPRMTARVRTDTSSSARHVFASASISGFILDLDPSITSYVFSVADAYRHGKQRMEHLAIGLPHTAVEDSPNVTTQKASVKESRRNTITSKIETSLQFMSGTVRMHCTSKDSSTFSSISPDWPGNTYQILDSDAEIFRLPELSVSVEYSADVRALSMATARNMRTPVVFIRSTVHSSRNALRPLVLSFVSGVVRNVEDRMKQASRVLPRPPFSMRNSISTFTIGESDAGGPRSEEPMVSGLQVFVSLRIDKSRLELTCRPDVNVIAGITWESGGFILNIGPGAKGVSISASIEGLSVGLKHGFLSDDSAHFDARNLIFSINFSKSSLATGHFVNSISVVVDTELSGGLRFSRFQDLLCFKAVWLDHIPVIKGDSSESAISPSRLSAVSSFEQSPKQGFDTAIVIHVRRIVLEVDLGQSICSVTLDLQKALNRIRLTSTRSELFVSFARVDMQARGNLSGRLSMPDFVFRTVRMRQVSGVDKQPLNRILELNLTSGTLDIQLQSDWLWLLQYRADPLEARIYDDWTVDSSSDGVENRQLHLYSSVSGTKVIAMMTIMALPKLMMYAGKLRSSLEAQRDGASRESSAFRSTRLPKPENALSEVANAMFRSARSKLKETESLSYVINQHMGLRLDELIFVVLPRSQGDTEVARVIGRNVMSRLDRIVHQVNLPAHRDLQLSLSHLSISQLLKQGFDPRLSDKEFDVLTTGGRSFSGTENVIFSLPAMDMRMITDEQMQDGTRLLPYDFSSKFTHRDGHRGEDIHISLNIRLYSWLTVLRKTFTRELRRAHEAIESKAANLTPATISPPRLASPDANSSPFAFENDDGYSPPGSSPSSRQSSRPASPVRPRSVESVIVAAPSKGQSTPIVLATPKFGLPGTTKLAGRTSPEFNTVQAPPISGEPSSKPIPQDSPAKKSQEMAFISRSRRIERLTVKQLGEATPDVMHPFFTKKAGFNLEESLPQYVHEYATLPIEEIMKGLVKLFSKQLD